MKNLAAIALAILASCAPKAIVVSPISPKAVVVSEAAKVASNQSIKVKNNTERLDKGIQDVQSEIIKGRNIAHHLAKTGSATPAQLKANADAWELVSIKNLFLEAAAQNAIIDASELVTAATRAKDEAAELRIEAGKADAVAVSLKAELAKQSIDAARGKAIKQGVWLVIAIGLIYLVIRFALPLFKPL
jgi:hypothetical protein